jgi:hypothetical protein
MLGVINLDIPIHVINQMSWVGGSTKIIFKNTLVSPRPQVLAHYRENSLPSFIVGYGHIIKNNIPASQRK